ncbi:MAG: hypothetical protein ACOYIR_05000 [Christensenellales bacterium]|jgi:hypothetical protein
MTPKIEADLVRLLELKRDLLTEMLLSLRRSAELLNSGDTDAFHSEMDKIGEIPAAVDELTAAEAGLRSGLVLSGRNERIAELEKNIAYVLGQIEQAHKECKEAAQAQLLHFGRQIKSVRSTQKGIEGYAGQRLNREAVFVDAKK